MLDLGWSEMAVIIMVALIVIGPKDLPRVAREIGRWSAKARSMAREFQRSLDDMAREAELQDIKAELEKAGRTDVKKTIEDFVDPEREITKALEAPATPAKPELAGPAAVETTPHATAAADVKPGSDRS
jgi:sec-independent protein translocase protein TatB